MEDLDALPYTLDEQEVFARALDLLQQQAQGQHGPLPSDLQSALLSSPAGRLTPLWLPLCHGVLRDTWVKADDPLRAGMATALVGNSLWFSPAQPLIDSLDPHACLSPAQVAQTAVPGFVPRTLQQALLARWFAGWESARKAPDLTLTQLLVRDPPAPGELNDGLLARLEFWLVPPEPRFAAEGPALLRAPGAALLPTDAAFHTALQRAQQLMQRVLQSGAPAVAWSLRPLPARGERRDLAFSAISGPSAGAALAWGALWLLRRHLRPQWAAWRELLDDIEAPQQHISITAELGALPQDPLRSPALVPIAGVEDKLHRLGQLPAGLARPRLFMAGPQDSAAPLPPEQVLRAGDFEQLLEATTSQAGSGLQGAARQLHSLLLQEDAKPPMDLLDRVAAQPVNPGSLRAWLVQRHALRASGAHRAFADPVRLDDHYVRLLIDPVPEPADATSQPLGEDSPPSEARARTQPDPVELRDLLLNADFAATAWCIDAPPFHGKTTLLARWEMDRAREALRTRSRHGEGHWGEVCVFLPMRAFQVPAYPEKPTAAHTQRLVQAFRQFIIQQANGLDLLPPEAPAAASRRKAARPAQPQPAPAGVTLRLLVDALNEVQARSFDERRRVVQALFGWMARHQASGQLLPPVLTVRTRENGLKLADAAASHLRARSATLLPWGREEWRRYIGKRLPVEAQSADDPPPAGQRLLQALRADDPAQDPQGEPTPFEQFCSSPGILAALCTLLHRWPDLDLPQRRGPLFMALLRHALAERGHHIPSRWLPEHLLDDAALELARHSGWVLPQAPGPLLDELAAQACRMQDPSPAPPGRTAADGAPRLEVPLAGVAAGLKKQADRLAWLDAVRQLGLAETRADGRFAFVHQQWQEFFSAWGLRPDGPLPDLNPPELDPPDEAGLLQWLQAANEAWWHRQPAVQIQLPAQAEQTERLRMAADLARTDDLGTWLRRLMRLNLPLAAQLAIDQRQRLEPQGAFVGKSGEAPNRELQHLRQVLLLRSMDAGERVQQRLWAGCVVGEDEAQAALAERMAGFDDELDAHWAQEWQHFQSGRGRDIRHRIEAGLLLGELGDNLRYEYVAGAVQGWSNWPIAGLRLKQPHWLWCGRPGSDERTTYRIGSDSGGEDAEFPSWPVALKPFQAARYAVTVQEWRQFMESGGYEEGAPWWEKAGEAAQAWLRNEVGRQRQPYGWDHPKYTNPLRPVVGISAFESLAYAAWADLLDAVAWQQQGEDEDKRQPVAVPTEVLWEAAVQGPDPSGAPRAAGWAHGSGTQEPSALDFNHNMHLGRRAPMGSYSLGATPAGLFDAVGNIWEWCSNVVSDEQLKAGWRDERWQRAALEPAKPDDRLGWRALRGGAFYDAAAQCRASSRDRSCPDYRDHSFGVRLVRVWPPHSEPGTPAAVACRPGG